LGLPGSGHDIYATYRAESSAYRSWRKLSAKIKPQNGLSTHILIGGLQRCKKIGDFFYALQSFPAKPEGRFGREGWSASPGLFLVNQVTVV